MSYCCPRCLSTFDRKERIVNHINKKNICNPSDGKHEIILDINKLNEYIISKSCRDDKLKIIKKLRDKIENLRDKIEKLQITSQELNNKNLMLINGNNNINNINNIDNSTNIYITINIFSCTN